MQVNEGTPFFKFFFFYLGENYEGSLNNPMPTYAI